MTKSKYRILVEAVQNLYLFLGHYEGFPSSRRRHPDLWNEGFLHNYEWYRNFCVHGSVTRIPSPDMDLNSSNSVRFQSGSGSLID
jgi:hypothetical protein